MPCDLSLTAQGIYLETHHDLHSFLASVEKRAFRMAEIATGNRQDALDILQDTMYKLVEKYAVRSPQEWMPLFYTILQSRIHDWRRREFIRNRFRVWFGKGTDEQGADPMDNIADAAGKTPEQELHHRQTRKALDQAVRALPARQQQAFMLRAFEGLDVAETARIMRCSAGSVKTHYSRSVQALRKVLSEDGL